MEGRANAISWLDTQDLLLKGAPLTRPGGYGFNDWEEFKKDLISPDNMESLGSDDQQKYAALKAVADAGRRVTGATLWRKEIAETRRADVEKDQFHYRGMLDHSCRTQSLN
jgi:hypothetical protein